MEVLLSRHFGFCYGVENAIEIAFRTIDENPGKRIFLLSEMIHNPQVNADLTKKGVQFLHDTNGNELIAIDTLTKEDVEITSQDIEGWLVANAGNITVALDITISEELRKEGIARELVNRIQNIRKDSGFEVTDKIKVQLLKNDSIEQAVLANESYIKSETLTNELIFVSEINNGTEIEFDELKTTLLISK